MIVYNKTLYVIHVYILSWMSSVFQVFCPLCFQWKFQRKPLNLKTSTQCQPRLQINAYIKHQKTAMIGCLFSFFLLAHLHQFLLADL